MRLLLLLCCAPVLVGAMAPTGPRSYADPNTGQASLQIGGDIVNYHNGSFWDVIDPNWGLTDSGLTVVKGPYSAHIDTSNGKIWYGYKGHYLGLEPFRLIWFRPADSTWTTIANADIDSFVVTGNQVRVPDPFGLGVELDYTYNPSQMFNGYTYTTEARDTLKTLYQAQGDNTLWLANVIRLDISRINMSLKRLGQAFSGGDLDGEDYLDIEMDSSSIAYAPSYLEWSGIDHTHQAFYRIKRRVVNVGGTWYFVELINPRRVDTLAGALRHNAEIVFAQTDDDIKGAGIYCAYIFATAYFVQNRGATAALEVGNRFFSGDTIPERSMIAFPDMDDTLIARGISGSEIDSAHLELYVESDANVDTFWTIHRVQNYWDEGTSSTGQSADGVSGWYRSDSAIGNNRVTDDPGENDTLWTNYETDSVWNSYYGGQDVVAAADDSLECCPSIGNWVIFGNTKSATALKSTCSLWVEQPDSNHGWMITCVNNVYNNNGGRSHYKFVSSDDDPTIAQRPILRLWYTEDVTAGGVNLKATTILRPGARIRRP